MPRIKYVGVDLESPLAEIKLDITDIPFRDDAFDVIICSHVLNCVVDDRTALAELYRVLRRDGRALFLVPVDHSLAQTFEDPAAVSPRERERLFNYPAIVRRYGRDFEARLEEVGFIVAVENYARELGEETATRYGISAGGDDIYVCTK